MNIPVLDRFQLKFLATDMLRFLQREAKFTFSFTLCSFRDDDSVKAFKLNKTGKKFFPKKFQDETLGEITT